eukprot:20127-Heterococcus_DN1.PRE.1
MTYCKCGATTATEATQRSTTSRLALQLALKHSGTSKYCSTPHSSSSSSALYIYILSLTCSKPPGSCGAKRSPKCLEAISVMQAHRQGTGAP